MRGRSVRHRQPVPGWDGCTGGGDNVTYNVVGAGGTANNFVFTVALGDAPPTTAYDIYLNDYGVQASSWDGVPSFIINPAQRWDCHTGILGDGGPTPHPAYKLHTFTTDGGGAASFTRSYSVPAGMYELQTALTRQGQGPAHYKTGDTFGSTETVVVP